MRWAAAWVLLAAGCAQIHTETRVERGPLLRSTEREGPVVPGGVRATVQAHWPSVALGFTRYELCRHEKLETYAEDHVTERSSSSAGAQLATGVSTSVIGGGLFAAQGAFSNAPNTRDIDGGGHYGPSDRQIAKSWSYVLLVLGIPALAMGVAGLLQSGEETKTLEVDQVVSAKETPCREAPASGKLELVPRSGKPKGFEAVAGSLTLSDADLRGFDFYGVVLEGRPVTLAPEEAAGLDRFLACTHVLPAPDPSALSDWSREKLESILDLARSCAQVPDAPVADLVQSLEAELDHRRLGGAAEPDGPRINSFEDALAAYQPQLRIAPEGDDVSRLQEANERVGQAVYAQGLFLERVEANIAVIDVAGARVLVFIPPRSPWAGNLDNGTRVELVGVIQGRQTLGNLDAPLVRAVWMRPAM